MCGIAGIYSTSLSPEDILVFKRLLLVNQLRGEDSTGVLRVTEDRQLQTLRGLGNASAFLKNKATRDFLSPNEKPMLLLGHTRQATKGTVVQKNAHPFTFQNVAGVMNGTFHGQFDNYEKFDTDTEAIYYNIDRAIDKDDKADPIPGLQASMVYDPGFALVFVNRKNGTLNFIRNDKRPLHFSYINNRQTLVWSSTAEMLEFILDDILKLPYDGWKKNDKDKVWTLGKHHLMQIELGKLPTTARIWDESKNLKEKEWVYTSSTYTTYPSNPQSQFYMGIDEDWEDYVKDDNGPDTNTGGSSKVLIKCDDGQYRTREAQKKRLDDYFRKHPEALDSKKAQDFRPPNTGTGKGQDNPSTTGVVINYGKGAHASKAKQSKRPDGEDLSTLSWLQSAVDQEAKEIADRIKAEERFEQAAFAETGSKSDLNRPQSSMELKHRLSEGCMCCGVVVAPEDTAEVARIRWWNRESWACGDCFEFSDGDWIRCSIEDDWSEGGKHKITSVLTGVQVH